jgi:DNA-binding SARP family transcriptional activator/TolB-like protein
MSQPKRFALLTYLAAQERALTPRRDSVVALFWPELDAPHARGALRQSLRFLRRELGVGVLNGYRREAVGFEPAGVWCDAVAFTQACDADQFSEALELYGGDFLEGFFVSGASPELDRWVESRRMQLRTRAHDAARALANQRAAADDPLTAARWAQRALSFVPDDEDTLRLAVRQLDRAGDRAGALRVYADFATQLDGEFGVAPSAETQELVAAVRMREERASGVPVQEPLPRPRAAPRRRSIAMMLSGAIAALALLGVYAWPRATATPREPLIAVLPFTSSEPDSALTRLGSDLAVTVSASLDGVADLRTVDRLAILARTRTPTRPLQVEDALTLGRHFGASTVIRGTLVRVPSGVRVDFGLYPTDSGTQALTGTVVAPLDVAGLTDSITWAVLRSLWRRGPAPTPSLASLTTYSVPAFRAFLDGEHAAEAFDWSAAAAAYERAIALDSTFWLAYQRYVEARYWLEVDVDDRVLERLRQHRQALPERDRQLVEAWVSPPDSFTLKLRTLQDLTRRFPEYSPGWFYYSDVMFHFGPFFGYSSADAQQALRTTLALRPNLIPVWQHLAMVSAGRDTQAFREAADKLAWTAWRTVPVPDPWRFAAWNRFIDRLGRTAGRLDRATLALADTIVWSVGDSSGNWRPYFAELALWAGFPAAQVELNRRMLQRDVPPRVAAAYLRGLALAWAARGAWDTALVAIDRSARADPARDGALDAYGLAALGAFLGAIDPLEAVARQGAAARAVGAFPNDSAFTLRMQARLVWLEGVVAFRRGDRGGLAAARQALRRSGPSDAAAFNERSLAAFETALAGNLRQAGLGLAELERYCANREACLLDNYDIAIHHLAAARWLLASGDSAHAARLLMWHEAGQKGTFWAGSEITGGLAYLESARLEDARGAPGLAEEYYQQFLKRYDRPMPAQLHLVREAQAALERLHSQR